MKRSRLLKFGLPILAFCLLVPLLYSRWVTKPKPQPLVEKEVQLELLMPQDTEDTQVALVEYWLHNRYGEHRIIDPKKAAPFRQKWPLWELNVGVNGQKAPPALIARLNRRYPFAHFYSLKIELETKWKKGKKIDPVCSARSAYVDVPKLGHIKIHGMIVGMNWFSTRSRCSGQALATIVRSSKGRSERNWSIEYYNQPGWDDIASVHNCDYRGGEASEMPLKEGIFVPSLDRYSALFTL